MMKIDEYQKAALSTAVYPRQYVLMSGDSPNGNSPPCIYPVFGLCGEIGEVAQVLADKLGLRSDLIKECGDVLWYISAICSDLSIDLKTVAGCDYFNHFECSCYLIDNQKSKDDIVNELFIAAGIVAEATKKTIRDSSGAITPERLKTIIAALKRILTTIAIICNKYNISFDSIAEINIEKLTARAANGTIKGNGDNR